MDISPLQLARHRSCGLTLVEMLTMLAVAGVLLTTGIPEFKRILASNRMITEVNTLVAHLHLARSEAVNRGQRAVLCPSADGLRCLGSSEWHRGYILFVDDNGNRESDAGEPLVRIRGSGAPGILITSSASRRRITYHPDGSSPGSNLTLTFCQRENTVLPKAVILSNTGRPRVSRTGPEDRPLRCS